MGHPVSRLKFLYCFLFRVDPFRVVWVGIYILFQIKWRFVKVGVNKIIVRNRVGTNTFRYIRHAFNCSLLVFRNVISLSKVWKHKCLINILYGWRYKEEFQFEMMKIFKTMQCLFISNSECKHEPKIVYTIFRPGSHSNYRAHIMTLFNVRHVGCNLLLSQLYLHMRSVLLAISTEHSKINLMSNHTSVCLASCEWRQYNDQASNAVRQQ